MASQISNIKSGLKRDKKFDVWQLISLDNIDLLQVHLKPAEEISSHSNSADVIFYVLEGSGILTIGSLEKTMNKGDCIFVVQGEMRGWRNNSSGILRFLIIKSNKG
jgi:quercetin dioxygenase-like cupin family protein